MADAPDHNQRLINVILDEQSLARRKPEIEHERAVAIYDLVEENQFAPVGDYHGPYVLHVRLEAGSQRLILAIHNEADARLGEIVLPLAPLRQIIRDYFTICESYHDAIRNAPPHRIEAIDMGRRGLHNEGSRILRERLAGMVAIDEATARRLFTLIYVLHGRG
ncbi:MAG TPA: UPF0262 family protein [Magnetospirillaceae bacterium]|jgi:uncharacterized protein (UPF0262 family)